MTLQETLTRLRDEKHREFWVKAQGHQYESPVYCKLSDDDYIDLTQPGENRWISTIIQQVDPRNNPVSLTTKWLNLIEFSVYEKEKQRVDLLLTLIEKMKLSLEFYGDKKHVTNINQLVETNGWLEASDYDVYHNTESGVRAREALSELKKLEEGLGK